MSVIVAGFVKNGVVVPNAPLPEGAFVEVHVIHGSSEVEAELAARLTPAKLRRMPREQRQAILAAAAELAEQDYRADKELTGFEAFSEEERDDDEFHSR
jgi:acyl-CoA reductase-like NAD-dependent aldehyde dehydrogenase